MTEPGTLRWRAAAEADLSEIDRIAKIIHPDLPERIEVFAEKIRLSPATCFVACDGKNVRGYAIAHPWRASEVPKLDTLLGAMPEHASVLFLHDVALLPSTRGLGLIQKLLALLSTAARKRGLQEMTLAAVYGSEEAWFRYGFRRAETHGKLAAQMAAYGSAVFMTRPLDAG